MKTPTKRETALALARNAGYHNDSSTFYRVYVEMRVASYKALQTAWREGVRARERGMPCDCHNCKARHMTSPPLAAAVA